MAYIPSISDINLSESNMNQPISYKPILNDLETQSSSNKGYIDRYKEFVQSFPSTKEFSQHITSPEFVNEQLSAMVGAPGIQMVSSAIPKAIKFIQPQKAVNEFMHTLGQGMTSEENITNLAKRISFGRKSAAEEALQHKRPVFLTLGNKQLHTIPDKTNYMSQSKNYKNFTGDLKDLHETFTVNPSLNNADALQQQLGDKIGKLKKLQYQGKLDKAGDEELSQLVKSRNHLVSDMDSFMEKQDLVNKNQYQMFRSKWRSNVVPYDENPILSEIVRKGTMEGITPAEIKNIFSYPSKNAKKIAEDIGPSGKGNILYNELQSENALSALDLSDALKKSKQFGYQHYINPEMEMLAKMLPSQYKTAELLKTLGKGGVGGLIGWPLGHPYIGAAIGAGLKPGKEAAKKVLEQLKK